MAWSSSTAGAEAGISAVTMVVSIVLGMRRDGRGFKRPGRRHRWERPWLRWPAQGTGAAPRVLASAAGQQGECRMKARIVMELVAGWMALAAAPWPGQSRAGGPPVPAPAGAAESGRE